jgi:hypothetical protein
MSLIKAQLNEVSVFYISKQDENNYQGKSALNMWIDKWGTCSCQTEKDTFSGMNSC